MPLYRHTASGAYPGGEEWSMSYWSQGSADITAAQAAWVNGMTAAWAALDAYIATTVTLTELATATITETTGRQTTRVAGAVSLAGTATENPLPPQNSVCISKYSSTLATSAARGRSYLPAFTVATVDVNGRLAAAAKTACVAAADAIQAAFTTAGLSVASYGRTSHNVTPLDSNKIGGVFDTQRRRRNKLAEDYSGNDALLGRF